jgi:hypothetical protein
MINIKYVWALLGMFLITYSVLVAFHMINDLVFWILTLITVTSGVMITPFCKGVSLLGLDD